MNISELPKINALPVTGFYLLLPQSTEEHQPGIPTYRNGVVLEPAFQDEETFLWKICQPGMSLGLTLNKSGSWEYEPMPSSRTEAYYRRCRFATPEEALIAWGKYQKLMAKLQKKRQHK